VQSFNDDLDEYVLRPVAKGYKWITPSFVDRGVTNVYSNINDISVFLNDFLQFKPLQGSQDAGRFLFNTVAGVGGFFDVADVIGLPKHKEDFDQTLAVWGGGRPGLTSYCRFSAPARLAASVDLWPTVPPIPSTMSLRWPFPCFPERST